jgi:PAS domain S-box-containing protein
MHLMQRGLSAAPAIEQARLETLARLARVLASELDPDRIVQTLVDGAKEYVAADTAVFVADARAADGDVSSIAVPVRSSTGQRFGTLCLGRAEPLPFGEHNERVMLSLASIAGTALENAERFRRLSAREAELAAEHRRQRLVNEATREGLWYWDVATNAVDWNDALLEAMGIARDAWGGTFDDFFSRLHPDDQPRLSAALKAHLERQEPYAIERFRLRHADGRFRWFTTKGMAEFDADGTPLRMAGSVRDVTDTKLAEDALRASEHRYAQILDSIGDLVFSQNRELEVVYANASTRRFAAERTPPGGADGARFEPRLGADSDADTRRVFETRASVVRVEEARDPTTGTARYFHTQRSPVFDEGGAVCEVVAVAREITASRRTADFQRTLAEASEILGRSIDFEQTLANVARAMVPGAANWCAVDVVEDGAIRRIAVAHQDEAKVAFAYELERRYPPPADAPHGVPAVLRTGVPELVTHIPDEFLVASAVDDEHLAIARALELSSYIVVPMKGQDGVIGAITLVTESGRHFDEQDLAFAEELARRASVAVENARLHREVLALNATLERRVEARTRELSEANRELEAFSYTVSHDLRAPVRHIGGFVDLLRAHAGERLDERAVHYVDTIKRAAMQMGALVDGLLAFSRLGKAPLAKRPVPLADVVESVLRELEPDVAGRRLSFEIGELPVVAADPTMIRIVLSNLLGNAVKYTRKNAEARVTVRCESREGEHVLSVRDDGAGFDMAYVEKLFGVFQRLHADPAFDGTGIGLATARRIVERHGGRIWAEAEEGRGATFYFTLPREDLQVTPSTSAPRTPSAPPMSPVSTVSTPPGSEAASRVRNPEAYP